MIAIKIFGIFLVAVVAELSGTYLVWKWLREGASFLLAFAAASALVFYAVLQTFQPVTSYGRLYAAYAGMFLIGALIWGWLVEGAVPDRFDLIGAALTLTGMVVILWGRQLIR
jgi:small multidrug resistance family-3 protein